MPQIYTFCGLLENKFPTKENCANLTTIKNAIYLEKQNTEFFFLSW